MHKRVSIAVLGVILVCVLLLFLSRSSKLSNSLKDVKAMHEGNIARISDLENEKTQLESTLATADSEAFIENQARTKYDYMMPNEIRFKIIGLETDEYENLEQEEIPSQLP